MELTNQLKYIKYFLIVLLTIGLYFPEDKITKIILPDIKTNYSQIIPEIDSEDIDLKLSDEDTNKKDDIIFTSNITFDEDKKVERIGIQLKTKF